MNEELTKKYDVYIKYGIIQIDDLNMNEKAILSTLCYWCIINEKDYCHTTYGILMKKFNLSKEQVRRSITKLINNGYIISFQNKKEESEYVSETVYTLTEKTKNCYKNVYLNSVEKNTSSNEIDTSKVLKSTLNSVEIDTHKKEEKEIENEINKDTKSKTKNILSYYRGANK